jgi:G8 domain
VNETDFLMSRNSINAVMVTISGVVCRIRMINETIITCFTGSSTRTNLEANVATGSVQYQYMNLWSSRWTWNGDNPPEAGTIVSVEEGVEIFLDISPPKLKALIIDNASLIFDDFQDLNLTVEYILIVNGGRLQIGTESAPFQHRAIITMVGNPDTKELPICNNSSFRKTRMMHLFLSYSWSKSVGSTSRYSGYAWEKDCENMDTFEYDCCERLNDDHTY